MKMIKFGNYILIILCGALLSACSPVKLKATNTYMFDALPNPQLFKKKSSKIILVATPETIAAYNTTDMAYSTRAYQIGYYNYNKWVATPNQMLQPLLERSLQRTHYFKTVVHQPYLGLYHYALATQILKLEQDYSSSYPEFKLLIRAQLSRTALGKVIASKQFYIHEPILCRTPYHGVLAANRAMKIALAQITAFTIRNAHR